MAEVDEFAAKYGLNFLSNNERELEGSLPHLQDLDRNGPNVNDPDHAHAFGIYTGDWQGLSKPETVNIVDGEATYMRFEIRDGDIWDNDASNGRGSLRSELSTYGGLYIDPDIGEVWSFKMNFFAEPENTLTFGGPWETAGGPKMSYMQIFGQSVITSVRDTRYSEDGGAVANIPYIYDNSKSQSREPVPQKDDIPASDFLGQWHTYEWEIKFDDNNKGYMRARVDDGDWAEDFNVSTVNESNSSKSPYFKWGMYIPLFDERYGWDPDHKGSRSGSLPIVKDLQGQLVTWYTGVEQQPVIDIRDIDTTTSVGGKVIEKANGTYEYQPVPGYSGFDTFEYRSGHGNRSDTATVTVRVGKSPPPDEPQPVRLDHPNFEALDDTLGTTAGTALTFTAADLTDNDGYGETAIVVDYDQIASGPSSGDSGGDSGGSGGGGSSSSPQDLRYSNTQNLNNSFNLEGATVDGDIAVFLAHNGTASDIEAVYFTFEDAAGNVLETQREGNAPYTMLGNRGSDVTLLDTDDYSDGTYRVEARIDFESGPDKTVVDTFTIGDQSSSSSGDQSSSSTGGKFDYDLSGPSIEWKRFDVYGFDYEGDPDRPIQISHRVGVSGGDRAEIHYQPNSDRSETLVVDLGSRATDDLTVKMDSFGLVDGFVESGWLSAYASDGDLLETVFMTPETADRGTGREFTLDLNEKAKYLAIEAGDWQGIGLEPIQTVDVSLVDLFL